MLELLLIAVVLLLFIAWKVARIAQRIDQFWKLQGAMSNAFYDPVLERSERTEKALAEVAAAVALIEGQIDNLHGWVYDMRDAQLEREVEEADALER